jgi:hypothetical protein
MGNLENVNLMYYICCMKNTLDVLVVMFTLVFGLSMFNWIHNFSPSFSEITEVEVVKEEEEE